MYIGSRILIVEDEPLIAMLIADWLTELGCEVAASVDTVTAALEVAGKIKINAALLDVNLGATDSFTLADALLAADVPVAFLTGRDWQSLPERFLRAPVLNKPFDFASVQLLLERLLAPAVRPAPLA